MKRLWLLIFVLIPCWSIAQQLPAFSHYLFDLQQVNAAYTGTQEALIGVLDYRAQWTGIDGAPRQGALSVHSPVNQHVGLGLNVETEKIGARTVTTAKGTFGYHVPLNEHWSLSMALRAGATQYVYNWNQLQYKDGSDPIPNTRDPGYWMPVFDVAALAYTHKYYIGIEADQLGHGKILKQLPGEEQLQMHFTAVGGAVFKVSTDLDLKPTFCIRQTQGAPLFTEIDLSGLYKKVLWLGVGTRLSYGYIALAQFCIKSNLRIGYSYDFATNALSGIAGGSHEISISYQLPLGKAQLTSPRYF